MSTKQKRIAIPIFLVFILLSASIKILDGTSYTDNVKTFYTKSNNFVKNTSILREDSNSLTRYRKKLLSDRKT